MKQKRKGTQPKLFVRPGTFKISGGSREGPYFGRKEEKESPKGEKPAEQPTKKANPPPTSPPFSSRSGSATENGGIRWRFS